MRGQVKMNPLFVPNVEMMTAIEMNTAPAVPIIFTAVSESTSCECAATSIGKTYDTAQLMRMYMRMTISVPMARERGRFRWGSMTSPATYVISIHPSYDQRTATIASTNGPARELIG